MRRPDNRTQARTALAARAFDHSVRSWKAPIAFGIFAIISGILFVGFVRDGSHHIPTQATPV